MAATIEDISNLTAEEKRIKIAELCGFKEGAPFNNAFDGALTRQWIIPNGGSYAFHELPDYLNDLNAMHEAEKMLSDFQLRTYGEHLQEIVNYYCVGVIPDYPRHLMCLAKIAGATAAQRADAFLLTFG